MKVVLVSDLHIHDWREFASVRSDGMPSRLYDCVSVLTDVRTYCLEHNIRVVVLGGDLFHKRGVLYTRAYNLAVEEFAAFKKAGITVLAVDGNHDHADKSGSVHAIAALASAGLVRSINPSKGYRNWCIGDAFIVTGLSYCDDAKLLARRLDTAEGEYVKRYDSVPRIVVAHHGFKGARVGSSLEYVVKEELDAAIVFKGVTRDYLFSGHYHQRQPIGAAEAQEYIGSPLEHLRGDGGSAKGFLVYDSRKRSVELVPLLRPRFLVLDQEQIELGKLDHVSGNFVDVRYEGLPEAPEAYSRRLQKLGAAGVQLAPIPRQKRTVARLDVDLSMSSHRLLKRYVKHTGTELDKSVLLRLGKKLLGE